MGNEKSALNGIEIDEKAIEVTDFWTQYSANVQNYNSQKVSVFNSEPSLHYTASFGRPTPLERIAKNLMLHRHPCILRYISSWHKGSKFFLCTEEAKPLIQVIDAQNALQICVGLYSIACALVFLHEKALTSHNNVCSGSIYITPEGCWKLGGFEYLCKFSEATSTYYQKIRNYRYERATCPNEDINALIDSGNLASIDVYAFGVLAEDILKLKHADNIPALTEFQEFCKENLQSSDASLRCKLSTVLQHPFFTHDFIKIHGFLEELPLKTNEEKEVFFTNLVNDLKAFPEDVVAEQLGRSLLSRIVLLDQTAQVKFLPYVLKPRDENDDIENSVFSTPVFKTYLIPRLLQMFCIRDVSIRLLLLLHFKSFVHTFQTDELKSQILPELLVGIKDTNDHLVCATLKALAEVVSILGAATVIGGKRAKLFTDGRPNKIKEQKENKIVSTIKNNNSDTIASMDMNEIELHLPERLSPDGGEDKKESSFAFVDEESTWSDWDAHDANIDSHQSNVQNMQQITQIATPNMANVSDSPSSITKSEVNKHIKKIEMSDISQLDIKHSKSMKSTIDDYDFFTDMEPIIKKTHILHVQDEKEIPSTCSKSIFDVKLSNVTLQESEDNDGWSEHLGDWDIEDTKELSF
ncbi:protein-associating with the carboxyl-terminal domain of ezrin isoform X1 [Vespula maculifrons]|uniref:Protein-associating with the carboxyl-terminal domain of ezrin isoform X1 n=1 Tax=Vespula maculifrons TaxID=7453 RepID=A0ABD2CC80_VESMC